jgi:aspartyl-tRNA(Asn)/glutamyl-tRNA(Gln) amidotransferase subunit A
VANDLTVTPTELHWLTIADAARLIESRRLSPVELTDALLARIDALDPQLNAFLLPTPEKARDQAKAAERDIMAGNYRGPLHGVPFGLKDIYATAGIRTTSHSKICETLVPTEDATTVTKLYQASGVLLGKLATHEFAHGGPSFDLPWPPARNPWNRDHFTGGSSSGAGAAGRRRLCPWRARLRHRRLDPRACGAVRHRGAEADLWPRQPSGRLRQLLHLRPCRPDDLDG